MISPVCPKAQELRALVDDAYMAMIPETLENLRKRIIENAKLGHRSVQILQEDIIGIDGQDVEYSDFEKYYKTAIMAWLATSDLEVSWKQARTSFQGEIDFTISWYETGNLKLL